MNNAAVRYETAFAVDELRGMAQVLSIVLDGAFLCAQAAAAPHQGGRRNDRQHRRPDGAQGRCRARHVITAKAGLAGMTKALALDLARTRR